MSEIPLLVGGINDIHRCPPTIVSPILTNLYSHLSFSCIQTSRPAVIEKKESGYLSSASSYPSPNNSQSSAMPSPPLSVATPPDSATYNTVSKQLGQPLLLTIHHMYMAHCQTLICMYMYVQWNLLNNGYIGEEHFAHVVLFWSIATIYMGWCIG